MDDIKKRGRTAAQDKYDNANIETISFKARKGSRMRLKEASAATEQSVNGFIRNALNKAVNEATGSPMEGVKPKDNEVKEDE
jgi:predicted HicB family RNase H-like nuclease